MTDIVPVPNWGGVRQLEANEYATGGLNGNMNEQAKSLAGQNMYSRLYAGLPFDPVFTSQVGGFPIGGKVALENGDIVRSTVANNTVDPNIDMNGWKKPSAEEIFDKSGESQQIVNDILTQKTDYLSSKQFASVQEAINAAAESGKVLYIYEHTISASIDVPANSKLAFLGALTASASNIRFNINGSNTTIIMPKLKEIELRVAYSVDDLIIFEPNIKNTSGFGIYAQCGFGRGMTRAFIVRPSVTITTGGFPIYIEAMFDSVISEPVVNSNATGRGISILSSRRSTVSFPKIYGSPITGIVFLSTRSITQKIGWVDNTLIGANVYGFTEEGISFDCRGNVSADCSTVGNAITTSTNSNKIIANTSTISTTVNALFNYELVFQTGVLAGRGFIIGASTPTELTMLDNFSQYSAQVQSGDIFTVEVVCRGNKWVDCNVQKLTTNPSDSGVFLWGAGRGLTLSNMTTADCNIKVANLRGIIGASQDYCVPHNIRLVNCESERGDIVMYAYSYNGFAKAYGYNQDIIDCKARELHRYRIINSVMNSKGGLQYDFECYLPNAPTVYDVSCNSNVGRTVIISDTLQNATDKLTASIDIPLANFVLSVKVKTFIVVDRGRAGACQEQRFIVRRLNETVSTFGLSNIVSDTLELTQPINEAHYKLNSLVVTPSLAATTTYNDRTSKLNLTSNVSGSGTGASSLPILVRHVIEISPLENTFTYY